MEGGTMVLFPEEFGENEATAEDLLREYILANNFTMEDVEDFQCLKSKTSEELLTEREKLQTQLEELQKENFSIRASVNAWQLLLESKLEEFKKTDLTLNDMYKEIWAERENFCINVDEFNEEFGVLSGWWRKQMKFVSELENLENKTLENKKCQQDIEILEKELLDLEKEIEKSLEEKHKQVVEVDVHMAEEEKNTLRSPKLEEETLSQEPKTISPKLSDIEERIEICEDKVKSPKRKLFSLVDKETVRKVCRKHRRFKKKFFCWG